MLWRDGRAALSQDQPDRQDDYKRAQGDNSNFEMKTTIHLRASNFAEAA